MTYTKRDTLTEVKSYHHLFFPCTIQTITITKFKNNDFFFVVVLFVRDLIPK